MMQCSVQWQRDRVNRTHWAFQHPPLVARRKTPWGRVHVPDALVVIVSMAAGGIAAIMRFVVSLPLCYI